MRRRGYRVNQAQRQAAEARLNRNDAEEPHAKAAKAAKGSGRHGFFHETSESLVSALLWNSSIQFSLRPWRPWRETRFTRTDAGKFTARNAAEVFAKVKKGLPK